MPGDISRSNPGPGPSAPYVPGHLYQKGPRMCPCGHHEGYHNDAGACLLVRECGCAALPPECLTPDDEFFQSASSVKSVDR